MKEKIVEDWDNFKNSVWTWFRDGSKYSRKELILNWIIIFNILLIFIFEIPLIVIRWKYLMGAFEGTYPPFMWCPMWAGVLFAILGLIEITSLWMKFFEVRRRKKYNRKSSLPNGIKRTSLTKSIDKKYTTIQDKTGKRKTFD